MCPPLVGGLMVGWGGNGPGIKNLESGQCFLFHATHVQSAQVFV